VRVDSAKHLAKCKGVVLGDKDPKEAGGELLVDEQNYIGT
jgi:hypothetical protein